MSSFVLVPVLFLIALFIFLWILRFLFPEKKYGIETLTQNGEMVRSRSEGRVANYFKRNNINYEYEKIARTRSGEKISHPDFFLPNYQVFVEFWGLVDAEDHNTRNNYVRTMNYKMARYHQNNIKFISIYPRNLDNLDWIFRTKFRKVTGFELPN